MSRLSGHIVCRLIDDNATRVLSEKCQLTPDPAEAR